MIVGDEDVQVHLPADKLLVEAVPDDKDRAYEDAEFIVRGYLAGVLEPATLAAWTTPANTPGQIRAVAGRLAAAKIYRLRFGEDSMDDPEYAQNLYNEAMGMLNGIIDGTIIIDGVTDPTSTFNNTYFLPNDFTDPPKFTMSGRF